MATMTLTQRTVAQSSAATTSFGLPVTKVLIRTIVPITIPGLVSNQILSFTFPYAPNQYVIDGLADEYQELARPGLIPLVQYASRRPLTISFKVLVTGDTAKGYSSAEQNAELLQALARSRADLVVVGLGQIVSQRKYRITEFNITSRRLNESQLMTMFDASITLTQIVSPPPTVPGMVRIVVTTITSTSTSTSGSTSGSGTGTSGGTSLWDTRGDLADDPYRYYQLGYTRP